MKIKRHLLADLRAHLSAKEITLLIGPRQAGKTTILRFLGEELQHNNEQCWFFNLDIDRDSLLFQSQEKIVNHLAAITGKKKAYIFIDEVQRIENAGRFLKGLYDRDLPYKFIVTGSGSLELKEKISESLAGRKRNFFLPTVSIQEWVNYATNYNFEDRLSSVLKTDESLEENLLQTYLTYGGYPRVITAETQVEKNLILQEIYQAYIERDIRDLLQLEKSSAFVILLQLLANRAGSLVNYHDLSKLTGLSTPTIKNYLWYSEKTFVSAIVTPFFRNKEKELVKAPQYYFWDIGLRNYLRGIYEDISDQGMRFQNMVFLLLQAHFKNSVAKTHYWRTQNQAEVDFVVNTGQELIPIEVKSGKLKQPTVSRSFRSFLKDYSPEKAWIINRSLRQTIKIGETQVHFMPWYDLFEKI